jgi:hypothetical protein
MITCVIISGLNGCAVFNRDNTPTLNALEKYAFPEDRTTKALLYPVLIPAGLAAASIDAFVVHPISVMDDAAEDVHDALWSHLDFDRKYATECAFLIPRTTLTPVLFTGDFLMRSAFDWNSARRKHERENNEPCRQAQISEKDAEKLYSEKKYAEASKKAEAAFIKCSGKPSIKEIYAKTLIADGKYDELMKKIGTDYEAMICDADNCNAIVQKLKSASPEEKAGFLLFLEKHLRSFHWNRDYFSSCNKYMIILVNEGIKPLIYSSDRAIAMQAIRILGEIPIRESEDLLKTVMAGKDKIMKAAAAFMIEDINSRKW